MIEKLIERKCRNCDGHEWVCEVHKDTPWAGLTGGEKCCGGAGAPCPVCQPEMANAGLHEALRELKASADAMAEALGRDAAFLEVEADRRRYPDSFVGGNPSAQKVEIMAQTSRQALATYQEKFGHGT